MKKNSAFLISTLMAAVTVGLVGCNTKDKTPDNVVADKYKITVACQTEMGEEEVLKVLKKAYEAKHTDVEVEIKTFSGEGFEQYMLGIAADQSSSPNIIWTADTYHSQWDQYFVDLRPYYESSEETDYENYYETMLDTASTNGHFKPTKNYKGSFRSDDLDVDSDGYENYANQSEYGLYYAPRDYNKPALLCNTYLFAELDKAYEKVYKEKESVSEMPDGYVSSTARLNAIVNGEDWDEFGDLFVFARFVAERIAYVVNETQDGNTARTWNNRAVMNLFLEWEPTYTTVMNELGIDLIAADGSLNIEQYKSTFETLHAQMFPGGSNAEEQIASFMLTTSNGIQFSGGNLFMTVCSRPVVYGFGNTFKGSYGDASLEAIRFPVENIAAGNSGYAISNIWEGRGMTVGGVYKSYTELSWDFIKFIITEEGQEAAGATGLNIPVLKKLYSSETNGGVEPAWRKVEFLSGMSNDAWVAGGELGQNAYNVFVPAKRNTFRTILRTFFTNLQKTNYNDGSLDSLIENTLKNYRNQSPAASLR